MEQSEAQQAVIQWLGTHSTELFEESFLRAFITSLPLRLGCPLAALLLGWKLQLQPGPMAGLPWARDSGTGTRRVKPYDWTAVGPFHATSGGKSTICLEQTAARASNEQMAIYRVKEKSFVFVLLLLAREQWLFQQRNPPPPNESHWF